MNAFAGVGRNASCPCGSGLKFKHCHGLAAFGTSLPANTSASAAAPAEPRQLLLEGMALQRRGDTAQARTIYERVLALDPDHPDAWHLLALLDASDGRAEDAVAKVRRAIATLPDHPPFHITLARALLRAGCVAESAAAARAALALSPENAEPFFLLGNALSTAGEYDQAIAAFRSGLIKHPGDPVLLNNLALALEQTGDAADAEANYRRAIALHSTLPEGHANLANLLFARSRYTEAAPLYEQAIALGLERAQLWATLGIVRQRQGSLNDALRCFKRADALQPNVANLQMNVGSVLVELGRADEALPHFDAALASEPSHPDAAAQRLYASQLICRWAGFDLMVEARLARVRGADPPRVSPFTLLSIPATPEDQYRAACTYAATIRRVDVRSPPVTEWTRGQRLRIGYLSSDLRRHPVGSVLSELLELHDRSRVEVFAYAHGPRDAGPERERLTRAVDHWRDVTADSDEQTIRHIRADGIHVLIDLNGYTQHERKEIAASRPAPVQISFLGYPGSCGGDAYDFVLTDRFVCPPEQQRNFSERFLYMPHCVMPVDTTRAIRDQSGGRAAYGLPEQGFVFCAFTNPVKIIPPMFDLWMRLLREIPESVLWLRSSKPAEANLRYEAGQRRVRPERIVFAQHCADLAEHLARHRLADLFLDTLPYGAHSTAGDALYAGLPVLTCAGDTFAGRVAGSQLHTIGLPELVTPSLPAYEALALQLAREPALLAGLRARLATNRGTGPLFDMARYVRAFEDRLEEAWEVCAAGGAPRAAALNADT